MNAHEFIKYGLEFNLNNPYIPIVEEIIGRLNGGGDTTNNRFINES
jgi:hypothetical protein